MLGSRLYGNDGISSSLENSLVIGTEADHISFEFCCASEPASGIVRFGIAVKAFTPLGYTFGTLPEVGERDLKKQCFRCFVAEYRLRYWYQIAEARETS